MISNEKRTAVIDHINTYVLHSSVWDEASDILKTKAVNQSAFILSKRLSNHFPTEEDVPADMLAEQTVWILRIDDTFLRAEMGASYIQMSGVMVNITEKDRSICPYVLTALGVTADGLKRKVGRYGGRSLGSDYSNTRG